MILDDIRDKAFETLQGAKARLEESDTYMQLKERYDSLTPPLQKLVLGVIGALLVYIVLLFPLSFYDQGSENLALFADNRDMILDLYKVKRKAASTPQGPPPSEPGELEGRARSAVSSARIQPEQIKAISVFDNAGARASSFVPKNVSQKGVEVRLANLNVSQIVDLGHAMNTLSESAKMVGLDVRAGSVAGNYFDVTFKVISFGIEAAAPGKKKSLGGSDE